MTPFNVTLSAAGPSNPIQIDLKNFRFGVGLLLHVPAGVQVLGNVEVTGDNPRSPLVHWNLHDLLQNLSASANGNLAFPVTAVRFNAASLSGGTIVFSVVQSNG